MKPTYAKNIIKEAMEERNKLDANFNGKETSQIITVIAPILKKMLDTPHWTSKSSQFNPKFLLDKPKGGRSIVLTKFHPRKMITKKRSITLMTKLSDHPSAF